MTLASLVKTKASRVLGIDASTNSVAFCLLENNKPIKWGKINITGNDIFVRSPDAVIKLSYVYGVVIAELMSTGASVITISPSSWQAHIGNKNPTKIEKDRLRKENPGYADSWYKSKMREIRKQRTVDYFNKKYDLKLDDFDVADSFGIAYYANEVLTKR